jgi:peptidoglycan/LPS O-acetylase OafA/YrhL
MQRVRQRALPVVVRRAQLLLIVLLPVLAARCAWLGGQIAAEPFLPYSTPGRLPILVGGLLLIAAWGCLLAS